MGALRRGCMKLVNTGKNRWTVGVLIPQLDGRYQAPLWHGIIDAAEKLDLNVVFFVGKSIKSPHASGDNDEWRHNVVYPLVSPDRMDALIVSSGSLANFIGKQDFLNFLKPYLSLPIVSIAIPYEGMASVLVDNKGGMKQAVLHLIHEHHFDKIAFVRGPETNPEAEDRFEAYRESLAECGIPFDPAMVVTGDFAEHSGEEAVSILLSERKTELQAVCCANDEMAVGVYRGLQKMGLRIPEDIAIIGFDDIEETRFFKPPFTTVRQPFYEQGRASLEILHRVLSGESVPDKNYLPAELVVRESCGCRRGREYKASAEETYRLNHQVMPDPAWKSALIASILKQMEISTERGGELNAALSHLLDAFLDDFQSGEECGKSIGVLEACVFEYFTQVDGFNRINQALHLFHGAILSKTDGLPEKDEAHRIFYQMQIKLRELAAQIDAGRRIALQRALWYLRTFLSSTAMNRSMEGLLDKISEAIPHIGIPGCYISLFPAESHTEDPFLGLSPYSEMVMACNEKGRFQWVNHEFSFPTRDILPDIVIPYYRRYTMIVQPLFYHDHYFGFIFSELGPREEVIYGILREQVSSMLLNVTLATEKEAAEAKLQDTMSELRRSEERYREMALMLPTAIFEIDLNLQIQYLNLSGREILGIEGEAPLVQRCILEFIHADDAERFRQYCRKTLQGEASPFYEFRVLRRDGSSSILIAKATPIMAENGVRGIRWSAIDMKPLTQSLISPEETLFEEYGLSSRQREILSMILQGFKYKDIAQKLFISENTVKSHVGAIYEKIGVVGKEELFERIRSQQIGQFGHDSYVFSSLGQLFKS